MKKLFFVLLTLLLSVACEKEQGEGGGNNTSSAQGVFVCNEGNFLSDNSSLSYYDPKTGKISNKVFFQANNVPLGDVCQNMRIIDNKGFVVINNSGKVYVIDPKTHKYLDKIDELTSPRDIITAGSSKLYISDLYSNNITIVDRTTYKKTGTIEIGSSTNDMIIDRQGAYVYSWSYSNKIYKIDTQTDKVVGSIDVTKGANSMALDRNNNLWVLSDGGYPGIEGGQVKPTLTRISLADFSAKDMLTFESIDLSPSKLSINHTGQSLFFINQIKDDNASTGIYKFNINDKVLPANALVVGKNRLFYGLGIDPQNGDLYATDAIDYKQKGFVIRYDASGKLISEVKADIIPSAFCFYNK